LALASLGFWLLLGFCSPHFCVGFLFFWCTSVRRLPPPTASLHTQLCHTQLIHRHTTMALGDIDTILLCGRCGTFCDIHTVFFLWRAWYLFWHLFWLWWLTPWLILSITSCTSWWVLSLAEVFKIKTMRGIMTWVWVNTY
jgi:hypothetical protein